MVVKISILVSASIVISSLVFSYMVFVRQERLYQNEKLLEMKSIAKFYSQFIDSYIWPGKSVRIIAALRQLNNVEGVAFIKVVDEKGKQIYYSENFMPSSYNDGRRFKYIGKKGGELQLRINDTTLRDNDGGIGVRVGEKEMELSAEKPWQDTGVTLRPGGETVIFASGTWKDFGISYVPDGSNYSAREGHLPYADRHAYSMIARVNDGTGAENVREVFPKNFRREEIREIRVKMWEEDRQYVGALTLGYFKKSAIERERDERVTLMAETMAPSVRDLLQSLEYLELNNYVRNAARDQAQFSYEIILDPGNCVIFHSDERFNGKTLKDPMSNAAYAAIMSGIPSFIQTGRDTKTKKALLDVAVPVRSGHKLIGIIRIGVEKEPLDRAIKGERIGLLLLLFACTLAGITVAVVVARRIARPILELEQAVRLIGRGNLDVKVSVATGGEEIVRLAESFNEMVKGLKERDFIKDTFSRYVTKQVADEIIRNPNAVSLGGKKQMVTVLFSDIRGFTVFSEKYAPEEVVARLNEYLSAMVDVIFENEGTLDKFIGDAVMAVFGSPIAHDDDPLRAVKTALDMQRRLNGLNEKWTSEGREPLVIGIGINTGEVIAGNIGDMRRMEYTVIGDNVNLASHIEGLTKNFNCPILMSASTYELVKDKVVAKNLGSVSMKGKLREVEIYELLS